MSNYPISANWYRRHCIVVVLRLKDFFFFASRLSLADEWICSFFFRHSHAVGMLQKFMLHVQTSSIYLISPGEQPDNGGKKYPNFFIQVVVQHEFTLCACYEMCDLYKLAHIFFSSLPHPSSHHSSHFFF
jgi:hypothetical protein